MGIIQTDIFFQTFGFWQKMLVIVCPSNKTMATTTTKKEHCKIVDSAKYMDHESKT